MSSAYTTFGNTGVMWLADIMFFSCRYHEDNAQIKVDEQKKIFDVHKAAAGLRLNRKNFLHKYATGYPITSEDVLMMFCMKLQLAAKIL